MDTLPPLRWEEPRTQDDVESEERLRTLVRLLRSGAEILVKDVSDALDAPVQDVEGEGAGVVEGETSEMHEQVFKLWNDLPLEKQSDVVQFLVDELDVEATEDLDITSLPPSKLAPLMEYLLKLNENKKTKKRKRRRADSSDEDHFTG